MSSPVDFKLANFNFWCPHINSVKLRISSKVLVNAGFFFWNVFLHISLSDCALSVTKTKIDSSLCKQTLNSHASIHSMLILTLARNLKLFGLLKALIILMLLYSLTPHMQHPLFNAARTFCFSGGVRVRYELAAGNSLQLFTACLCPPGPNQVTYILSSLLYRKGSGTEQ